MTKVLHINDYPMEAGGGAEVVLCTTVDLLRCRGVHVETFTGSDLPTTWQTPWRYVDNRGAREALAARLRSFRPDVVHLHNFYHLLSPGILVSLAEYKARQPLRVVMTAHDYHLACPNAGGSWFRWCTGRREAIDPASLNILWSRRWDHRSVTHSMLKLAQHVWNYRWHRRQQVIDLVICPSRFVQTMLAPLGFATRCLPHPAPMPAGPKLIRMGPLRFVFAGRLEPEKGIYELLRIWPAESRAALTVIGAGAEMERCRDVCMGRSLDRVAFIGRLPHAETLARIADAHVLIQPSLVLETYGLTLLEALASGTNILAADRGAAREIVAASGVGFLYDPDSAASLADQLAEIQRRHNADALNRFDVADFLADRSEKWYVEQLLDIYGSSASTMLAA